MTVRSTLLATSLLLALATLLGFVAQPAHAVAPVNAAKAGVAIQGYDPVAYFTVGKPTPGNAQFEHRWNGALWRFASAANRDTFAADPERYAPRYGGYCAYGVSQGYAVDIDPQAWTVVDGRLYLNYSLGVRGTWSKDIPGHIAKAEANWPGLAGK
jgi:YHS domain-containing protein